MADDFLDGGGIFVGGTPIPPVVPVMDLDLGEGYRPSDFIYGRDYGDLALGVNHWQKINEILSPVSVLYKVAIGALTTIYDESLYVHGRIYPLGGVRLGSASTITVDGSGNIVFADGVSGSVTLAQLLAAGSGNVSSNGTPTNGQLAQWINATTIKGIDISSLTLSESQITNLVTDLAGKASTIHNLIDTTNHPVSGLTAGQFLKALSATTYGFTAHGLTATDIGLGSVGNYAQVRKISTATNNAVVRWDMASGDLIQDSLMILADDGTPNIPLGKTYNVNGSPHTHAGDYQGVDATLTALAALDASAGFIYQTGADTFVKYTFSGTGTATSVARSDHDHDSAYISDLDAYFGSITANYVYASPDGSAGSPTFRALVSDDIPSLAQSKITDLVNDLAGKQPIDTTLTTLSALSDASGFLSNNGTGILSWASASGTGNVSNVGTPVDNQVAVWTDATHIEGSTGLTYLSGVLGVSTIDAGDGVLKHLALYAGDASGGAGTDAGDLILKAGSAIYGDSGSFYGKVYIVPGNDYSTSLPSKVYFGDSSYNGSYIILTVESSGSNMSLDLWSKGSSFINIGENSSQPTAIRGLLYLAGNLYFYGLSDSLIYGANVYGQNGPSITIRGGHPNDGNFNGGNLYLYGGAPYGTGTRGNVYFGDGASGFLPAKTSETNVVYYNTSTGLLSYGAEGGGGGGDVYKSGTPVDNQIAVWTDDHTIEGISGFNITMTGSGVGEVKIPGNSILLGLAISGTVYFGGAHGDITTTGGCDVIIYGGNGYSGGGIGGDVNVWGGTGGGNSKGGDVTIYGGVGAGTGVGGNIYIRPGTGASNGNTYFGTGSSGTLPAKSTETDVVYYAPATGLLSYGASSIGNHALISSYHTAAGLTTGHFLKATSSTTFSFAAHGLGYSDVGAAAASHSQAESTITFTDITTGNATTGAHGYLPKLGGGTVNYLRADGQWATPPSASNYWQRIGTNISPATTGDTVQVNTYYIGANSEGILNASANTSFNISAAAGLVGTPTGRNLCLYGGNPYNTAGADAGHVIISGGTARSGDSGSAPGNIYLVPGNGYTSGVSGAIYLGNSSFENNVITLEALGISTNISINIIAKGTGNISLRYLAAKTSETNIVYYDTSTGKLSYGAAVSGPESHAYWYGTDDVQCAVGVTGLVSHSTTPAGDNLFVLFEAPISVTALNQTVVLYLYINSTLKFTTRCHIYTATQFVGFSYLQGSVQGVLQSVEVKWSGTTNIWQYGSSVGPRQLTLIDLP